LKVHKLDDIQPDLNLNFLEDSLDYNHPNPHDDHLDHRNQRLCVKNDVKQCAHALKGWILDQD
jgi:hypothetical protein